LPAADDGTEDAPADVLTGLGETRVERALDLAARWLIGYGILSLVLAALVLVGTLVIAGRLTTSTDRLLERVQRIGITLDTTAAALDQGVDSAERFETTLEELAPTLERTTAALRAGSATLTELATATDRISLLGQRPFAGLTASLIGTAAELSALATSLDSNAATLDDARTAIARMGTTLPPVAQNLRALRTNLEPDVRGVLDDVRGLIPLAGVLFALWLGVPGAGAYVLGRRIRRALRA
jgi:methyl-accepting chemotaxis protein